MAAENITELKEYLKKAYDLESTIYSYEQIRQHMQERRNKVHKDCEETLYVRKYEYGDVIPYYQHYGMGGAMGGIPFGRYLGPNQTGVGSQRWGDCAPEGYPGKKHLIDYKIIDNRILVKRTPEEIEDVKANNRKKGAEADAANKSLAGRIGNGFIAACISTVFGLIAGGVGAIFFDVRFLSVFLGVLGVGTLLGIIFVPFLGSQGLGDEEKTKPEPKSKTYLEQKAAYEKIVDERNAELAKAHGELDYCTMTEQEITPFEARARKELKEHYASNLIHPKYQNFLAISQIYDYIDTGRCDKLEGPDGAYNIFEFELRMNTIISDLRVIQQKLDEVIRLQHSICAALHSLNAVLGGISSQLDSIQGSINANTMAINDFNASVSQKLNWI